MDYSTHKPLHEDTEENDIRLSECINQLGFGKFQFKVYCITSVIWLADAMEIMMIASITPSLKCAFGLTDSAKALLSTVVFVGMLFGAFVWGIFADRYGRKKGV